MVSVRSPHAQGGPSHTWTGARLLARRAGFGITEVVVALVVFAVGALGAAALTAHAARLSTRAVRYENALERAVSLLDSLTAATDAAPGTSADADAEYRWSIAGDSAVREVRVRARLRASADTIRLSARRPVPPPRLTNTP